MKDSVWPIRPGKRLLFIPVVLFTALLFKDYYSDADSDSLSWILGPTAMFVEFFSGIDFFNEPGQGWVNRTYDVVIAPSCSGGNFLIIIFCMSSFQLVFSALSARRVMETIALTAVLSYLTTIMVNGVRVWLSIFLYRSDIYSGSLTPEAVHRLAGICVYYIFLCFYYLLVSFILKRVVKEQQPIESVFVITGQALVFLVPLCWYLLFALGVPFVNNAYGRNPELFVNHSLTVFITSVLLTIILSICVVLYRNVVRFRLRRAAR